MRQKVHRPARHPGHRRFQNTGNPIANRSTTLFLCTQMVNKQEQRKRRRRSERWHSPRPGNTPKRCAAQPGIPPIAVSTTLVAPLQTVVPPHFFAHIWLTNKNNEKEDVEANVGVLQGWTTCQKARRPALHPVHRRFQFYTTLSITS